MAALRSNHLARLGTTRRCDNAMRHEKERKYNLRGSPGGPDSTANPDRPPRSLTLASWQGIPKPKPRGSQSARSRRGIRAVGQAVGLRRLWITSGRQPVAESAEEPGAADTVEEWQPPLAIGASLGDNLSAIQWADRQVEQWRAILEYHREHLPDALPAVQVSLDEAMLERRRLTDVPANTTPV